MEPPTGYSDFNYSPARRPYNKRNIVYRRYILAENEGGKKPRKSMRLNYIEWNRQARKERQGKWKNMLSKHHQNSFAPLASLRLNKKNSSYKIEVIVV